MTLNNDCEGLRLNRQLRARLEKGYEIRIALPERPTIRASKGVVGKAPSVIQTKTAMKPRQALQRLKCLPPISDNSVTHFLAILSIPQNPSIS
jgi:hypothetical protein